MYQMKEDILETWTIRKEQDVQYIATLRADKAKVHFIINVFACILDYNNYINRLKKGSKWR